MLRAASYPQKALFFLIVIFSLAFSAACTQAAEDAAHEDDHEHTESEPVRIPNNGAVIRIVSPADGAVFAQGEDIVVEVEIENFVLNVDGSHWHVYVDGVSYGMVVGDVTSQVLRNLEPGEHEIAAHLANGDHEELEDAGVVTITVED